MSKVKELETPTKELSIDEIVSNALAKQQEQFEAKLKQRETNEVRLSCRVVEMSIIEGKAILDKETRQQKEVNGELQYYPNKYTAKLSFIGGEIETPITRELFESLIIYSQYLAIGRIGEVKEFGNTVIKPIFSRYTEI
jgi:lipopolysaccharide assembly outer membrane protein LptD (OstA)